MFDLRKETVKKNIFLLLAVLFIILTFTGALLVITGIFDNAGCAVIPSLFGMVFLAFYRNSKKAIEENRE